MERKKNILCALMLMMATSASLTRANAHENGYFLERPYEANLAEESGSLKAIQPGVYKIIPHTPGQRFKWYLEGVPGRFGIAIHSGNKPEDSMGCLLTGTSVSKINDVNYEVRGSISKLNNLFALFEMYGNDNISITITQ